MEDLSAYRLLRLSQIDEVRAKIGPEKFDPFRNAVFGKLRALTPGDIYDIERNVRQANRGVFVLLSCEYMILSGRDCNIEISNDWTAVKGVQSVNEHLLELEQIRNRRTKRDKFYEKTE